MIMENIYFYSLINAFSNKLFNLIINIIWTEEIS